MTVRNKKDMSSIMSGYGVWSDMVVTLKDGTKFIVPEKFTRTEKSRAKMKDKIQNRDFSEFTVLNIGQ